MHEMSLVESVLDIINEMAKEQSFQRVAEVTLEIGCDAAVEPEAMRFCFDVLTKNTIAQHAKLVIVTSTGGAMRVKDLLVE